MDRWLVVLFGGAAGSLLRYVASTAITGRIQTRFPLGTFVVNITGSFLIGFLMALLAQRNAHPNWRLLLVTGFLGGYTTFSSFEYETYMAVRGGSPWMGLVYVLASVAAGYLAVWFGSSLIGRQ